MAAPLPPETKIQVVQALGGTSEAAAAARRADAVLLWLAPAVLEGRWPRVPWRRALAARLAREPRPRCGGVLLELDAEEDGRPVRVVAACVEEDASAFARLERARELAARILAVRPREVAVWAPGAGARAPALLEAGVAALLAAAQPMPSLAREAQPPPAPRRVRLLGLGRRLDLSATLAGARGNHLARWLAALPPNVLTPDAYVRAARRLARRHGWRTRFLDRRALERAGAGAFLAVARAGSRSAGILHLAYRPRRRRHPPLALVGKGVCFDTGGVNLKPARHMQGMHADMQGSAVVLGTLAALTELRWPGPVDAWLAIAENLVGPEAYRPHEVVRAADGTAIEVVHTDAEGRMLLADALALAARARPAAILDYATLTGACIYALGPRMSGVFSNREALHAPLVEAGRESGERVWPFPTEPDYDEALRSEVADVRQCTLEGEADHILAARFLSRFVPKEIPWVHVDLAAAEHKGGLAHVPTRFTGFGVRWTLALLGDPARRARLLETAE